MSADRVDNAETDEDGGGGDEKYEIMALRETVGNGGQTCSVMPKPSTRTIQSWMSAPCGGCGGRNWE